MGFAESVSTSLSQYATFSGRARRSEYWWTYLAFTLAVLAAYVLDVALSTSFLGILVTLALFLPVLAAGTRRLHDTGRSGWWQLIGLIPLGGIVLLVFWVKDSDPDNQYGPSPKAHAPGAAWAT